MAIKKQKKKVSTLAKPMHGG